MAVSSSLVDRLPMTTGLVYLAVGALIGPAGWRLVDVDLLADAALIERITEIALLFSLFTAGLKLRVAPGNERWHAPIRLASVGMVLTVAGLTAVAVLMLGQPWPTALLIAAILAPTDPVLASEVQVTHSDDRDRVRLTLTGEAGMNDGTAFPFVLLGLGCLGAHDIGAAGWKWVAIDVVWSSFAGAAAGWALGRGIGRFVVYLRRHHQQAHGLDDFVAMGLIAASYGLAIGVNAYGFLAVFAAGLAVRRLETEARASDPVTGPTAAEGPPEPAAQSSAQHLTREVLSSNLQMERIGEVVVVILLGTLLTRAMFSLPVIGLALTLFFVVRPLMVVLSLRGLRLRALQEALVGWFGVRGAGSLFYLAFAINHGLSAPVASTVRDVVLPVLALSIVIHGVSVTPIMAAYARRRRRPEPPATAAIGS